jgi:hypothetical protein
MNNSSTQAVSRQIKVPFHGAELYVVEQDGQPYTPMKPIVEGIGVSWQGQHAKLAANGARWGIKNILIPSIGGSQATVCLPLRKLPGWLMTMEPNKVRDAIVRERVIQYQNECDDVLWQYWNEGIAINPRMTFSVNPGDVLTADQQETLRLMVKTLVERLPKSKQGGAATRVWSKLKAHFKVPYRQIPQFEFTEAVSIVTRTAAEWEVVDPEPEPAAIDASVRANIIALCTHMRWAREWWREFGPGINHLNPNAAGAVDSHFMDGTMAAQLVGRSVGFEFPISYARNYPWRLSPYERLSYDGRSMTAFG